MLVHSGDCGTPEATATHWTGTPNPLAGVPSGTGTGPTFPRREDYDWGKPTIGDVLATPATHASLTEAKAVFCIA